MMILNKIILNNNNNNNVNNNNISGCVSAYENHKNVQEKSEDGENSAVGGLSTTTISKVAIEWDINDSVVPNIINDFDDFHDWANGHCRLIYSAYNEDAKRHSSGWAMRNTNNHNVNILKKSCLGVLLCTAKCKLPNGHQIQLRPAICDKARRKQQGRPCPNRYLSLYLPKIMLYLFNEE